MENSVTILGVTVNNVTQKQAIDKIEAWLIVSEEYTTKSVFLANAHTLNLGAGDSAFRDTLNRADTVYGDGTGVRWAARIRHARMRDNLVGTDLIPALFMEKADRGYSYFLLGASQSSITAAAEYAKIEFPGWKQAGYSHGYLSDKETESLINEINNANVDVLLVGMGNSIQEQWIDKHRGALTARVCIGVGGLFDHWSGGLSRAPLWVRKTGFEWLQLLMQSPRQKARRYLLGNPLFLYRIARSRRTDMKDSANSDLTF